jgi:TolA-binding protein
MVMKRNLLLFAALLPALISVSNIVSAKSITDDQKILYIDEQIRFADGLVSRGHYDLAIAEYIRLTKKFADDPLAAEAWMQLAEAYAGKKDFKLAISTFNTFFKKFPQARIVPAANLKYALVLYKTGEPANKIKALSMLNELKNSKKVPSVINDAAGFHLGRLYLDEKKTADALREFEAVAAKKIEKSPQDDFRVSALIELALLRKKQGDTEKALKLLSSQIKNSKLSQDLSIKLHWLLGELYFDTAQYQKAADIFAEFAVMFPNNPVTQDALYKRLQALYMMKDYTKVVSATDRLIKDRQLSEKGWERFYCIRSSALNKLNFNKKAIASLQCVLTKSKDDKMIQFAAYKYIETELKNGNLSAALKLVEKYTADPQFSPAVLKDILLLVTDYSGAEAAEQILKKSLRSIDPNSENAILLNLKLGAILIKEGKYDDALKVYQDITATNSKKFLPYSIMGEAQALDKSGKRDKAAEKYKLLMKQFPKNSLYPEAMLRIAIMYLSDKKEWGTAKIYLSELIKRFPDKPTAKLATFYQGYLAFYEKQYKDARDIFTALRDRKDITPELKRDISLYLIWSLIRLNDIDASILIFNSLKDPKRMLKSGTSQFLIELGNALIKKNPSSAQLCFKELINRKNKKDLQAGYIGISQIMIKNGDPVKGIELLREAIKLQGDLRYTNEAMITLGNLLVKRGKDEEAVLIFEKSLENPFDKKSAASARLGLAKILAKQDDRLKTANRYAMSVFILSDDKKICSEAMLLSIKISLKMHDKKSAETTWKEFQKRFPDLLNSKEVQKIAEHFKQ